MNPNKGNTLIGYGVIMVLLGVASVLYNPEAKQIELYMKAKTGLFICGGVGIVSIILGLIAKQGKNWAHIAWAVLAFMFMCVAGQKCFKISREVANGIDPHRWYQASLFLVIFVVSLAALIPVLVFLRREKVT